LRTGIATKRPPSGAGASSTLAAEIDRADPRTGNVADAGDAGRALLRGEADAAAEGAAIEKDGDDATDDGICVVTGAGLADDPQAATSAPATIVAARRDAGTRIPLLWWVSSCETSL
jgi:hypothetical protein